MTLGRGVDVSHENQDAVTRRCFLTLAGGAVTTIATASALGPARAIASTTRLARRAADQAPPTIRLTAEEVALDLGGRKVTTWGYNGTVPGPLLRVRAGDSVRAAVTNGLPERTTIHWHGIRLANGMDGVPDVTQAAIPPSGTFDYEFEAPDPGTYFFHPHVGLQLDHGLYGPLIVDDPAEAGGYDAEWVLVLDDWTDGVGPVPDTILSQLRRGTANMPSSGSEHGMGHGGDKEMATTMNSAVLGGHAGDVDYPLYLINGRPPNDPETFVVKPGQRVRLRLINAASDTAFRVAIGGHRLTVTHADGFAVEPRDAASVLLGMGERIDAVVTVGDEAVPLVARAEGKDGDARAVLRGGTIGDAPSRRAVVRELRRVPLTVHDLRAAPAATLPARSPDRRHRLILDGDHRRYRWTINGRIFDPETSPLSVAAGERVRLIFDNRSTMWHPMHLHGHTFGVVSGKGAGARKDTVVVRPGERIPVDFDAKNPGTWMVHCHNAYHQEAGMMTSIAYR